VVHAVDKKKARLNCIAHLLDQIPYQDIAREPVILPARVHNPSRTVIERRPPPADVRR
jgi:polyphosphate kinase